MGLPSSPQVDKRYRGGMARQGEARGPSQRGPFHLMWLSPPSSYSFPLPGCRIWRHPSSFEMRCTVPVPIPSEQCDDGRQPTLISPEVAEPVGRKLGVADGVLDVPVAEIVLQGSGVVPIVGKLIAARMPQHVRMQLERHPGGLAEPLDKMVEVRVAASSNEG